jgi:dihydroorotate dehydrogenase (fumarate)
MVNLKTNYLGLELKNPIIVGACSLSADLKNLLKLQEAGASAIVYKSLFEEQIHLESLEMEEDMTEYNERNAEMVKLFPELNHAGPEEHLNNLRLAKQTLSIPVIASLNATYKVSWLDYASQIEATGVDAIELNFYAVPEKFEKDAYSLENFQIDIVASVKNRVKIPVSVKLSPYYANPLNVIKKMDKEGVKGFVLFNRLFQPDINIEKEEHITPFNLSAEHDIRLPLRFAGLLYGNINANICANTGVFSGADVIKTILAGSDCVQVASTLYQNGAGVIGSMLTEIEKWMKAKNYNSIADFKGKLSNKTIHDPFIYRRAQYIDLLLKSDTIFKKPTML